MAVSTFDKGDLIRVSGAFTNGNDAAVDPDTVTFKYKNPSGTVTTLVYNTDAALVRDSTGNYHVDIDGNETGEWFWRWESTGSGQAADEGRFKIDDSKFD